MTCEEFLNGYRDALDQIDEVDLQIREAELRLEKTTSNYAAARVAGGSGGCIEIRSERIEEPPQRGAVGARVIGNLPPSWGGG